VALHEGLGSISMWRDFPQSVAAATNCATLVWSRCGYGRSTPIDAPRPVGYMHREAQHVLPRLLDALSIRAPILVGHSDGASIALIHAGSAQDAVSGVVAMAPHVFVEDVSIASIEAARVAYRDTDLAARLARHHADVDAAFRGWNDVWLAPDFRHWNIEDYLGRIHCPVLAIQGEDDEYGTMAQVDAVAAQVAGPVEQVRLARCGHSPHRDQPEQTLAAIVAFVERLPHA
jgi:pimeloyl-ACP methyl ester carboxylesterase